MFDQRGEWKKLVFAEPIAVNQDVIFRDHIPYPAFATMQQRYWWHSVQHESAEPWRKHVDLVNEEHPSEGKTQGHLDGYQENGNNIVNKAVTSKVDYSTNCHCGKCNLTRAVQPLVTCERGWKAKEQGIICGARCTRLWACRSAGYLLPEGPATCWVTAVSADTVTEEPADAEGSRLRLHMLGALIRYNRYLPYHCLASGHESFVAENPSYHVCDVWEATANGIIQRVTRNVHESGGMVRLRVNIDEQSSIETDGDDMVVVYEPPSGNLFRFALS
ncbi:hypothetical protein EDD17DRAFT_1503122 [Pisolithus thermaeus]|nr:hypothetical protein EDD17DRAFT_1503122 [Pisolithus thermaeus]